MELTLTYFGKTMGIREIRGNDSESGVGQVKFEMPLLSGDIK